MQFREKLEKIYLYLEIPLIFQKAGGGIMDTDKGEKEWG